MSVQHISNGSLPYLFSPVSDTAKQPAPLVLFLHGARDSLVWRNVNSTFL